MVISRSLVRAGPRVVRSSANDRARGTGDLGRTASTRARDYGRTMQVTVNIDVPSIEKGLAFFGAAFGFEETSRPHPGYATIAAGGVTLGLLAKPAGSSPAEGSEDVRSYGRHWTPVHVDFRVDDFDQALERIAAAGARVEQMHRMPGVPPIVFCSDPFGNGFCLFGPKPE